MSAHYCTPHVPQFYLLISTYLYLSDYPDSLLEYCLSSDGLHYSAVQRRGQEGRWAQHIDTILNQSSDTLAAVNQIVIVNYYDNWNSFDSMQPLDLKYVFDINPILVDNYHKLMMSRTKDVNGVALDGELLQLEYFKTVPMAKG